MSLRASAQCERLLTLPACPSRWTPLRSTWRAGFVPATASRGGRPAPSRWCSSMRCWRSTPAVDVFVGLSWRDLPIPEEMRVVSYGALGRLGRLPALEVVPCHYSALPRLFASRELPGDVAADSGCAARCARALLVRRRRRLPRRRGRARPGHHRRGQRPLPAYRRRVDRLGSARRGRAHVAAAARGACRRAGPDRARDRRARRRARGRRRHDHARRRRAARGDPRPSRRTSRPRRPLGDDLGRGAAADRGRRGDERPQAGGYRHERDRRGARQHPALRRAGRPRGHRLQTGQLHPRGFDARAGRPPRGDQQRRRDRPARGR